MKLLLTLMPLIVTPLMAKADATYSRFKKTGNGEAELTIVTDEEAVQAVNYIDAGQLQKFIELQLKDRNSALAKVKAAVIEQNCSEVGTEEDENGYIVDCGSFEMTPETQIEFARSGWADGTAAYVVFFGFRAMGTGQDLSMSKAVVITESVTATETDDGEFSGTLTKTYSVVSVKDTDFYNEDGE